MQSAAVSHDARGRCHPRAWWRITEVREAVAGWSIPAGRVENPRNTAARPYPARLPTPEHTGHFVVETITTVGTFRFGKRLIYLANALSNQRTGMEETNDGRWSVYFHTVLLATFDERDYIIQY